MKRFYTQLVENHFLKHRQMLFLTGPRQVGKTTIAQSLKKSWKAFYYFNWDVVEDRQLILKGQGPLAEYIGLHAAKEREPLVVFDELHKYKDWKNFLKGFYDAYADQVKILVTGSAHLNLFHHSGDSLMGRYFYYRIHPFSVAELVSPQNGEEEIHPQPREILEEEFENLWEFGGYPDPYLTADLEFFKKWSRTRKEQLFKGEIQSLTTIRELDLLEVFAEMLAENAGQQLSYSSYSKHLRVSDKSIRSWCDTLTHFYYSFNVKPWSKNVARSLIKEPKTYLWDWALVKDAGRRAENFVASHLLKAVHLYTDQGYGDYQLWYLRTKDQREVDFLVTKDNQPWFLVEVKKSNSKTISPDLVYFHETLQVPHAFQVVMDLPFQNVNCFEYERPVIVPAKTLLSQLA